MSRFENGSNHPAYLAAKRAMRVYDRAAAEHSWFAGDCPKKRDRAGKRYRELAVISVKACGDYPGYLAGLSGMPEYTAHLKNA